MEAMVSTTGSGVASPPLLSIPQGRWLHYGINKHFPGTLPGAFSEYEWNKACSQAVQWHLSGVTPKVAEGAIPWYDEKGLKMLRDVAHKHGLHIIPMHYVYGDLLGKIFVEVSIAATVGAIFGAYIPDMEREWAHQPKMMTHFGSLVRHGNGADSHYYGPTFSGPIYPTTYGNPGQHPEFPYVEMNAWSNGWVPQIYFNLWTFNGHLSTAEEAESHVYGQWLDLDKQCVARSGMHLKPVLPLIGLEPNPEWKGNRGPDPREIHNWLVRMQWYGYCGFWSDETYAPYAQVVEESPMPQLKTTSVPPPPAAPPQQKVPPSSSPIIVRTTPVVIEPPRITVPSPMLGDPNKSSSPPLPLTGVDGPEPEPVVSPPPPPPMQKGTEGAPESQGAASEEGQVNGPPVSSSSSPSFSPPPGDAQPGPVVSPDITETETQLVPTIPVLPPPVPVVQQEQEEEPPPVSQSETILNWIAGTPPPAPQQEEGIPSSPSPSSSATTSIVIPDHPWSYVSHHLEQAVLRGKETVQDTMHPPVFSEDELRMLWTWGNVVGLLLDTHDPFYQKWRTMLEENYREGYDSHVGYPTQSRKQRMVGSVTCTYLTLSSGLMLIQFDPHGPVYVL